MSRVRIEVFDGDFEDAPSYTRESVAECEGDRLLEAFERAVAMARAALPPDGSAGGDSRPRPCRERDYLDPGQVQECSLPAPHPGIAHRSPAGWTWPRQS